MKIELRKKYKSLYPFVSDELPKFVIITGKNGSGKSQLIQLLSPIGRDSRKIMPELIITPILKKVQAEGLAKNKVQAVTRSQYESLIEEKVKIFEKLDLNTKKLMDYFIIEKVDPKNLINGEIYSMSEEYRDLLLNVLPAIERIHPSDYKQFIQRVGGNLKLIANKELQWFVMTGLMVKSYLSFFYFARVQVEVSKKVLIDIDRSDFYDTPVPEYLLDSTDLFLSSIELIFYSYAERRKQNRINFALKSTYSLINSSISDDKFIKEFTPPWEILNSIFDRHNLNFHFEAVDPEKFVKQSTFTLKIFNVNINETVDFNELSTGEQILVGIVLKIFSSGYYEQRLQVPDLIVLDEPDAHLHPEMSKLLVDLLQNTFVDEFGINVIITTHSPSTIAFAPYESVFSLTNGPNTSLKRISKDEALDLLTSFLPLNIDYKNHKHVFVESPTDVFYYQSMFNKFIQDKKLSYKLYFISNANGKSNCDSVYKIVRELREYGNNSAFGVVDWDKKRLSVKNYVYAHGFGSRYSIENFLLDPIYFLILLIDNGNAHSIMKDLNTDATFNQYNIGNEDVKKIQSWVDIFFEKVSPQFSTMNFAEKVNVEYFNGKILLMPQWYLLHQGHEIVTKIKIIFPALTKKFPTEGEIQKALTIIASKCYPFVPSETFKMFEEIGTSI